MDKKVEKKSTKTVLRQLREWFEGSVRYYATWKDHVEVVENSNGKEGSNVRINLYTEEFCYHISAKRNSDGRGRSYLGCTLEGRKLMPGRTTGGFRDLPDGPLSKETWENIIRAILGWELHCVFPVPKKEKKR